jgi:hypothetical protein
METNFAPDAALPSENLRAFDYNQQVITILIIILNREWQVRSGQATMVRELTKFGSMMLQMMRVSIQTENLLLLLRLSVLM